MDQFFWSLEWVLNPSAKTLLDWSQDLIVGWPPNWFVAKGLPELQFKVQGYIESCARSGSAPRGRAVLNMIWCWPTSWIACSLWSAGIFFTGHACLEFNSLGWAAVSPYDGRILVPQTEESSSFGASHWWNEESPGVIFHAGFRLPLVSSPKVFGWRTGRRERNIDWALPQKPYSSECKDFNISSCGSWGLRWGYVFQEEVKEREDAEAFDSWRKNQHAMHLFPDPFRLLERWWLRVFPWRSRTCLKQVSFRAWWLQCAIRGWLLVFQTSLSVVQL